MDAYVSGIVGFIIGFTVGALLLSYSLTHSLPGWEDEDARIVEYKAKLYKLVPVEKSYNVEER